MSNPNKTVEREIRQITGGLPHSFITRNIREQMDVSISINSMNSVLKRLVTSGEVKRLGRTIRHGESFTLYQKTSKFTDEVNGFSHLRNARMAAKNLESALSNWRTTL